MRCVITKSSYSHTEDFGIADIVVDEIGDNIHLKDLDLDNFKN